MDVGGAEEVTDPKRQGFCSKTSVEEGVLTDVDADNQASGNRPLS
jgi:hypothetical protein